MKALSLLKNYFYLSILWLLAKLPYSLVILLGHFTGIIFSKLPLERIQVVKTNLSLCFPDLSQDERRVILKKHWRLLGRSALERGKLWLGSAQTIRDMVHVRSEIELNDKKPRIYVTMHMMGIEAGLIGLAVYLRDIQGPPLNCSYTKIKNPFFEKRIKQWRERFQGETFGRQNMLRKMMRGIHAGHIIAIAPDMDFGLVDSIFVPFFNIPTCTITTISRLAKKMGAEVCPVITTLRPDEKGYACTIKKPWPNFPTDHVIADTTYMNAFFEEQIRLNIPQYWWLHKRFKNRPEGQPSFYK